MKSIRTRLVVYMLLFIVSSLLFGWVAIYRYVGQIILEETLQNHEQIVGTHVSRVESVLQSNENFATTIGYTPEVQSNILECYRMADSYSRHMSYREFEYKMKNYAILRPEYIANIYLADETQERVFAHSDVHRYDMLHNWTPDMRLPRSTPYYSGIRVMAKTSVTARSVPVVSYMLPVYNIAQTNDLLGYLLINLDMDMLFGDAYQGNENIEGYYLTDEAGQVVYSTHYAGDAYAREIVPGTDSTLRENGRYFISRYLPSLRMNLVAVVRESGITTIVSGVLQILLIIMGLCLAAAIVTSLSFGRSITRPIRELTASMMQVAKGNFDIAIPVRSKDELGKMSQIFNYMSREIKNLIEKNNEMNEKQKNVTMKLFLSKINPHFIYNTLNCIIYLARQSKTEDIILLTRSFIQILHKNIAFDTGEVTIGGEKEYLESYIAILKYRYNDILEIRFDIPEEALSYRIQPMVLYPIVENSVFHGISARQSRGTVSVSLREENGRAAIRIADDGIGIEPEKLSYIREYLLREDIRETSGNIGLRNTNDRLTLYYGPESSLRIESTVGEGTVVSFSIPIAT